MTQNNGDWGALLLTKLSFKPVYLLALSPNVFDQYVCYHQEFVRCIRIYSRLFT